MGKLHDALLNSGYVGDALERLLVRLLFCLFADDTGIFERGIFLEFIQQRTREDGSDTGPLISLLFEVLNTKEDTRLRNLDEDLAKFPYINGGLFEERLAIPSFDAEMRKILIEACAFNWNAVSPAIFGSLFQSVMDNKERRAQGAHYTTEKNILKVIKPLFLDDLWAEFNRIKSRKTEREKHLKVFRSKLRQLRFLDPACGCGNFLVIAYREIRILELELIKELKAKGYLALDASLLSIVDVDQFYGIELGEFPRRIAEVALW
ncbi:type IIL restriction-modification enzyme MmeI, partial [Oleidesulfovibrio alaskensis]